jgi:hypothetical protein
MRTEFPSPASGCRPARSPAIPLSRLIAIAASGLLVTACAASKGASDYQSYAGAPPVRAAVATPPRPDLEADGLPAQAPPRRRANPLPVDPSEPFSPNYGPPPVKQALDAEPEPAPVQRATVEVAPALRHDAPAERRLSPAEADAVIARAIMAHEQRYP